MHARLKRRTVGKAATVKAAHCHGTGQPLTARTVVQHLMVYAMPSPVCPLAKFGDITRWEIFLVTIIM
jgi:hypothetical protein